LAAPKIRHSTGQFTIPVTFDRTMKKNSIYQQRVRDVMVTDVVAVNPQDRVSDALQIMLENRVSALPVVDHNDRCVGVISATDLLQLAQQLGGELDALYQAEGLSRELLERQLEKTGFSSQLVQEVMTHKAVTIGPDSTLVAAATAMIRNQIHRLAVTDAHQKLQGIISTTDIIRALAESAE
jgi:CBS domain-containing protein